MTPEGPGRSVLATFAAGPGPDGGHRRARPAPGDRRPATPARTPREAATSSRTDRGTANSSRTDRGTANSSRAYRGTATAAARVLVVDDEPTIRGLLRLLLQRDARFELVGEAADAEAAIARAAELRPDVVLLDLVMPGRNGRDALPALRAASPNSVVLVLSSLSARDEEDAALGAGAAGYLEKSVLGPRLPDVLAEHLARARGDDTDR